MLRALLEAGIVPDLVVGTSVGAVNGVVVAASPVRGGGRAARRAVARPGLQRPVRRLRARPAAHAGPDPDQPAHRRAAAGAAGPAPAGAHVRRAGGAVPVRRGERGAGGRALVQQRVADRRGAGVLRGARAAAAGRSSGGETFLDGGLVHSIPVGRAVTLGARTVYVLQVGRIERPLRPPRRPWEVGLVAFEVARRHRFAADMAVAAGRGDGARAAHRAAGPPDRPAQPAALPGHRRDRRADGHRVRQRRLRRGAAYLASARGEPGPDAPSRALPPPLVRRFFCVPLVLVALPLLIATLPLWVHRRAGHRTVPARAAAAAAAAVVRGGVAGHRVGGARGARLDVAAGRLRAAARRAALAGRAPAAAGLDPGPGLRHRPAHLPAAGGRLRPGRAAAAGPAAAGALPARRPGRLGAADPGAGERWPSCGRGSCSRTRCSSTRPWTSCSTGCPTASSRRGPGWPRTSSRRSPRWPRDAGPGDAVVIFPEGGNFSERRRVRAIERLRRLGHEDEAAKAEQMRHLMAPKPGGTLAAIGGRPGPRTCCWSRTRAWRTCPPSATCGRGLPMDDVVDVRWWHVPSAELPRDRDVDAQVDWLFDWWTPDGPLGRRASRRRRPRPTRPPTPVPTPA